jgi:hypothetical protein
MDQPIGDSSKQIAEMKAMVGRDDMKVKQSKHFVLMHDTPDTFTRGRLTRADERIQLLETVYECFLLRFYAYGVKLEIPTERLKVILFNEYKQYRLFADKIGPELASASGFWEHERNTSVFFDHGTNDTFKALKQVSDELQQRKKEAVRDRDLGAASLVRLADTIKMLIEIEREDSDISVVSHEATHQMAGNTGLLPRHVRIPSWVHEGLATYFETPDGATWAGVGAVNEERLEWFRALDRDRVHSNIGFIVGDQIFDYAGSLGSTLHAYGQAWALTHFFAGKTFRQAHDLLSPPRRTAARYLPQPGNRQPDFRRMRRHQPRQARRSMAGVYENAQDRCGACARGWLRRGIGVWRVASSARFLSLKNSFHSAYC